MSHKPWHTPTQASDTTPRQSLLSCARKFRWTTAKAADIECERLEVECPPPAGMHYNAYPCDFCCGYHCGKTLDTDMEQSA